MFHMIIGGSGSGKSEYAENVIVHRHQSRKKETLFYIATMFPGDGGRELNEKIKRHQHMRSGKGFQTVECYTGLVETAVKLKQLAPGADILLECMSNLTANEMFQANGAGDRSAEAICAGIDALVSSFTDVVVVTNDVSADCVLDTPEMRSYKQVLGEINQYLGIISDRVTEVVYGIPVEVKR